tara:strand:- start:1088 stop:2851 length:1764 start_codon:yes stop_codon:yes gene_type:complete
VKGHICCILSEADYLLIDKNKFHKLNLYKKSIIKVLATNKNIRRITLGIVKTPKNSNLKLTLKEIIFLYERKICDSIDFLNLFLRGLNLKNKYKISNDVFELFNKKIKNCIYLSQDIIGIYSYTNINQGKKNNGYYFDMFVKISGIKIEKGNILNKYSNLGLLSLENYDLRINRNFPAGLWEIVYGDNSGITAHLVDKESDLGTVICISRLKTNSIPRKNRENIYAHIAPTLQIAINKIYLYGGDISKIGNEYKNIKPNFKKINRRNFFLLRFLISFNALLKTILFFKTSSLFWKIININDRYTRAGRWGIAITKNKNLSFDNWCHLQKPIVGIQPKVDWHADPFLIEIDKYKFVLTEKWIQRESKGIIYCNQILEDDSKLFFSEGNIVLENSEHLSFPFCFKRGENFYMIPENGKNGSWLYKLELNIEKNQVLLNAIKLKQLIQGEVKDPSLVRIDDIDYLLASEINDESSQVLHAFVSKNIVSENIVPHTNSPIIVDHSLGRAAGRIFFDERLKKYIRPSQIGMQGYGEGIKFSEIIFSLDEIEIIPLDYEIKIEKNNRIYQKTHHYDQLKGFTAMDYKLQNKIF